MDPGSGPPIPDGGESPDPAIPDGRESPDPAIPDGRGDGDRATAGEGKDLELVVVAAVAENGVIGDGGDLPWHYPEDLAHFRETTIGHPVIVGRRTYESIVDRLGEPLPGRTNVVLTTGDPDLPAGAVRAGSVEAAIDRARETGSDVAYVVGGASVYRAFLDLADRMVITEIPESPEGDTHFPAFDRDEWAERNREARGDLAFVEYERR